MADEKLSEKAQSGTLALSSKMHVVNDPTGTPLSSGELLSALSALFDAATSTLTNKTLTNPTVNDALLQDVDSIDASTSSPTQITANQNDFSIADINTAAMVNFTTDGSNYNITGVVAPTRTDKIYIFCNDDASGGGVITFPDEDSGSTVANRFNGEFKLAPQEQKIVLYKNSRWTAIGGGLNTSDLTVNASGQTSLADSSGKGAIKVISGAYTVGTDDVAELYGGTIYIAGAHTVTLPEISTLAEPTRFACTCIMTAASAGIIDPNANDRIVLDGVALDNGDSIIADGTINRIVTLRYYDADGPYAMSDGNWSDNG